MFKVGMLMKAFCTSGDGYDSSHGGGVRARDAGTRRISDIPHETDDLPAIGER